MKFNVPILFLIFNRLDTTKEVFEEIRKVKPSKLYIACDGAREDKASEKDKVQEIRLYVLKNIDWDCDVKTLFRDKNLGCKLAVSAAISWFFQNEEMGIILEDDCLPNNSFFKFCEECLEKYKNDERVFQINGISVINKELIKESYFFSKYNHIWGWASWRRAWKKYEIENNNFDKDFHKIKKIFNSSSEKKYWYKVLKNYFDGNINTWDYPWLFTIWKNNGVSIYPKYNMIRNIGMGHIDATHTIQEDEKITKAKLYDVKSIVHPSEIRINKELDKIDYNECFKIPNIFIRILRKVKKLSKREHSTGSASKTTSRS